MPTPPVSGRAYMQPVARVMSLYRRHVGQEAVGVNAVPEGLDVVASRMADRIFLHVVNTNRTQSVATQLTIEGMTIRSGRIFEIAIDPMVEVTKDNPDVMAPVEKNLPTDGLWTFPAASVSAVELDVQTA